MGKIANVLKNSFSWTWGCIQDCDIFTQTVNFTFNGKTNYSTLYGGLISLLVRIWSISYAIALIITVFKKNDTKGNSNIFYSDLANSVEKEYIGQNNVQFAVGYRAENHSLINDPQYFNLRMFFRFVLFNNNE